MRTGGPCSPLRALGALCFAGARVQPFLALPRQDRLEHAIGRSRQLGQADSDRIADRVGERRRKAVQRTLARFLRPEGTERIVGLDELHFDGRRLDDRRDAVIEHVGTQRKPVVILRLFGQRLSHAHPYAALHLPLDGERIDCIAAVVRDPDPLDGDGAGVLVDRHLDDLCRIREPRRRAARSAALPTMNDTRDEYEPLSFGVSALSVATTRMRSIGSAVTSATTCDRSVDDPWPMSEAPVRIVMPPSKSSLRLITACGSPLQCTGFAEPDT